MSNNGESTMTDCSISHNTAETYGGGIFSFGELTMVACTIADNTAHTSGGGVSADDNLTMINCTVANNMAYDARRRRLWRRVRHVSRCNLDGQ